MDYRTPPSKILFVITGLRTGGAEMMLFKLLSSLDRNVFEPSVLCLGFGGPMVERVRSLGVPVICLNMKRAVPGPFTMIRLARQVRKISPAIIQGWMYHGNLAAMVGSFFSGKKPKVIWNIRCTFQGFKGRKLSTAATIFLCAKLSRFTDRIIYCSDVSRQQHEAFGYSKQKSKFIPNGFDLEIFKPNPEARKTLRELIGVGSETPIVSSIGRYHPQKDHIGFIQVAAKVLKERPDVHFILLGDKVDPLNNTLTSEVKKLQIEDRVHLLGERKDISAIMPGIDIIVSSSIRGEGFPNVLGEAMACGILTVSTDVGDSRILIGGSGRVTEPGDLDGLGKEIVSLLSLSEDQRRELSEGARKRIEDHFQLSDIVKRYQELYESILKDENN